MSCQTGWLTRHCGLGVGNWQIRLGPSCAKPHLDIHTYLILSTLCQALQQESPHSLPLEPNDDPWGVTEYSLDILGCRPLFAAWQIDHNFFVRSYDWCNFESCRSYFCDQFVKQQKDNSILKCPVIYSVTPHGSSFGSGGLMWGLISYMAHAYLHRLVIFVDKKCLGQSQSERSQMTRA